MTRHRITAVLFSALLLLILCGPVVRAATQAVENPFCAAQSTGQEAENGQRAAEVVRESPTPLAQPINGKNGPSPLILCGVAAIVVAVVVAAIILRKARKFE